MSNQEQGLVKSESATKAPVSVGNRGVVISDLEGLWRFSQYVQRSGLAPKGIQTGEAIFVAIQMGLEVGLTPMAALQNIAVINGRPSIWGDAQLAVCRGTGELVEFDEWFEVKGERIKRNPTTYTDDTTAVCKVKRRGFNDSEVSFSVADAKAANLWGKQGPWREYPWRMLRMRARSFALRDQFGDALRGMRSAEEVADMPTIDVETSTVRLATLPAPSDAPTVISGDDAPQRTTNQDPAPEVGTDAVAPQAGGSTAPAEAPPQAATAQPAPAPAPATAARTMSPALSTILKQLSRSGFTEADALAQVHRMFEQTKGCTSLAQVDEQAPTVINAVVRKWADFVGFMQKAKAGA